MMRYHRTVFIAAWITLAIALNVFPGGNSGILGFAPGLMVFVLFARFLDVYSFALFFVMVGGSAVAVALPAWLMDKVGVSKKMSILLIVAVLAGAAYFGGTCHDYATWTRLPEIEAAMESGEANYQPTRSEYYKSFVVPRTIAGGLAGVCLACGLGGLWALLVLAKRYQD